MLITQVTSLLIQERGLKSEGNESYKKAMESLLIQERGLKLLIAQGDEYPSIVAPYTGAWIEILGVSYSD